MLISPAEPPKLKELGRVSSTPEKYGCDFIIIGHEGLKIGIQRKEFPNDFLSSLADGRLYDLLGKCQDIERRFLLVEGFGQWTAEGDLVSPIRDWRGMNRNQYHSLLFSIMFEFGMPVLQVRDINQSIEVLVGLEKWARKKHHTSLYTRPGVEKDSWGRVGARRRAVHIMQGFPRIGPVQAGKIVDRFEGAPLTFWCSVDELMEVEGIGRKTAEEMVGVLDAWVEGEE